MGKERKLSSSALDKKKLKNVSAEGPTLIDQELGDHDFSILDTSEPEDEKSASLKEKKRKLSDSPANSPKTLSLVKKLKTQVKAEEVKTGTVKEESEDGAEKPMGKGLMTHEQVLEKYPLLKDEELIKKYLAVTLTNNQRGRLRQRLRAQYMNSDKELDADLINMALMKAVGSAPLDESAWRKIRILHNMLTTATQSLMEPKTKKSKKKKKKKSKDAKKEEQSIGAEDESEGKSSDKKDVESDDEREAVKDEEVASGDEEETMDDEEVATEDEEVTTEDEEVAAEDEENGSVKKENLKKQKDDSVKVKGPKRYVVFVGNLPYDVDKDAIMRHFSDLVDRIKDVRIPKKGEDKKGGIAYLELRDEPSYQMALSKHHTMFANRRINVLYTTSGKGKVDKNEAKGKTAKLIALQRSGQLLGSVPFARKRSARRKKQRAAQAAAGDQG